MIDRWIEPAMLFALLWVAIGVTFAVVDDGRWLMLVPLLVVDSVLSLLFVQLLRAALEAK